MVAERRDLMVETYSSYWGTGAAAMVSVCTGIACGAACGGPCLAQAVNASKAKGMHCLIQTGSLLKVRSQTQRMRRNACVSFLYLETGEINSNSDTWMRLPRRLLQKFYRSTQKVASSHSQKDFSLMLARLHQAVGVGGLVQGKMESMTGRSCPLANSGHSSCSTALASETFPPLSGSEGLSR